MCQLWALHVVTKRLFFYIYIILYQWSIANYCFHFNISYCRLLLHDSMLKYDSHRSGTSKSPLCDCGLEDETSEHFLLRCSMYGSIRDDMFQQLSRICIKKNKTTQITESLLLAPHSEDDYQRAPVSVFIQHQPSNINQHYLSSPSWYIPLKNSHRSLSCAVSTKAVDTKMKPGAMEAILELEQQQQHWHLMMRQGFMLCNYFRLKYWTENACISHF